MAGIRVTIYDGSGLRTGGEELLEHRPHGDGAWTWVDLEGVDKKREAEMLRNTFGIESIAIQDAQRERHPPKVELFDSEVFILVRELQLNSAEPGDPGFNHLSLFVGADFLVTRRSGPSPAIDQTWKSTTVAQLGRGPGHIVYRVCRRIVEDFTPFVIEMEEQLGEIEDRMFQQPSDDLIEDLAAYNRILKKLRRTLTYQHAVMQRVGQSAEGVMTLFDDHEFNDIYENMERLASLSQLNQELAVDLLNTYLSIASHRLNQIMRVLTIVAVIFLPLGLLAGIYGMNFDNMPELHFRYGYFVVIGIMITVVLVLIGVLKRKKWL